MVYRGKGTLTTKDWMPRSSTCLPLLFSNPSSEMWHGIESCIFRLTLWGPRHVIFPPLSTHSLATTLMHLSFYTLITFGFGTLHPPHRDRVSGILRINARPHMSLVPGGAAREPPSGFCEPCKHRNALNARMDKPTCVAWGFQRKKVQFFCGVASEPFRNPPLSLQPPLHWID